jgi:flagellar biosynthetic protein FliQ
MTDTQVLEIAVQAMAVAAKLCAPVLLVSLGLGLAISLVQAVTQIQEPTLTFVPKLIGVALVLIFAGNWMLQTIMDFTRGMFALIPQLLNTP